MTLLLESSPNETAQQLTDRDYVSWSAISTFRSCPLKWHFRYALGMPEETVSSSLAFGGAIHQAVELHYRELLAGNSAPDLDTLLYEYQAAWNDRDLGAIKFGKGENLQSLCELAERVLVAFQESPASRPDGRIVGVEEELRGRVIDGCPDLLARVDLLVDLGDELVVTDLKTARSRWSQQHAEVSSEQLMLYGELAKELLPGKPLLLQFVVITKAKSPVVELHEVELDQSRIERTKRAAQHTWRAMEAGHIYPAPSPMNCSGCPFREPCRNWTGQTDGVSNARSS